MLKGDGWVKADVSRARPGDIFLVRENWHSFLNRFVLRDHAALHVLLDGKTPPEQTNPNRFELFLKAAYAQAGEFCI